MKTLWSFLFIGQISISLFDFTNSKNFVFSSWVHLLEFFTYFWTDCDFFIFYTAFPVFFVLYSSSLFYLWKDCLVMWLFEDWQNKIIITTKITKLISYKKKFEVVQWYFRCIFELYFLRLLYLILRIDNGFKLAIFGWWGIF